MLSKKRIQESIVIRKNGDEYELKGPVFTVRTKIDLANGFIQTELASIVADLTMIYFKSGRKVALEILKLIPTIEL